MFEPFVQVGNPALQKGTGLGLTITRQQVELMGGRISVESAPGKGSRFDVYLPSCSKGSSDSAAIPHSPAKGQGRIMFVDDEEAIVELNIPTGVPLVYELDDQFKPIKHYYLGNQDEVAKAMAAVANQGKVKN